MIVCRTDAAQLATIALGQEIIVKGKFVNNSGEKLGQLHMMNQIDPLHNSLEQNHLYLLHQICNFRL